MIFNQSLWYYTFHGLIKLNYIDEHMYKLIIKNSDNEQNYDEVSVIGKFSHALSAGNMIMNELSPDMIEIISLKTKNIVGVLQLAAQMGLNASSIYYGGRDMT